MQNHSGPTFAFSRASPAGWSGRRQTQAIAMPKDATPLPARWRHRPLLALAAAAMLLAGAPRLTYPEVAPQASQTELAGQDELLALVASFNREEDTPQPAPDRHSIRAVVSPHSVRLAVDPKATHPLSGPVAVRQPEHLGSPGQPLRLVSLTTPEPAAQPLQAIPPEPAKTTPATPTASQIVVKNMPPAPLRATSLVPAAVARTSAPASGRCVLVAGDSLSIFLAEALRPMLASRPGTAFTARGKVSSGLARPDFFDWEREMASLTATSRPDTVIVMIAANDNKTLNRPDGSKVAFGRPGWDAEYARRVRRIVELARQGNPAAHIYWVGAPVMADERLNADVASINNVIARQLAALPGCRFVDVSRTLADATGRYTPILPAPGGPRAARTKDGVHLTPFGAKLLAHATLESMSPTMAELTRP
jgi:uncharacterized protein